MSSFNNQGYRKDQIRQQVKHLNGFYSILEELDVVAKEITTEGMPKITPENLEELANAAMGRPLDSLELMVIRGKLGIEKPKFDEGHSVGL